MAKIFGLEKVPEIKGLQAEWADSYVLILNQMFKLVLKQEKRQIIHVDADAFFASVEQVLNPALKGKAILVAYSPDQMENRGIVSAASYEAKRFGIHGGMAMYKARKLCPSATVVKGNFDAYRDFSKRIYGVLQNYSDKVEMASIDEAYLDISGSEKMFGCNYQDVARRMLFDVYKQVGVSVSCGVAINKTVAKVASSTNKPHKLTYVPWGKEREFLAGLPINALPGVGRKTYVILSKMGFEKVKDLAQLEAWEVIDKFDLGMIPLWRKARGIDNSPVIADPSLPKSISKEETFYNEVLDKNVCLNVLKQLSTIVFSKLRYCRLKAKTVTIRIRYKSNDGAGDWIFRDKSFQKYLDRPTATDNELWPVVKELFLANLERAQPVRLVGVGVANLLKSYNLSLFEGNEKYEGLFETIDNLRMNYGDEMLRYGI